MNDDSVGQGYLEFQGQQSSRVQMVTHTEPMDLTEEWQILGCPLPIAGSSVFGLALGIAINDSSEVQLRLGVKMRDDGHELFWPTYSEKKAKTELETQIYSIKNNIDQQLFINWDTCGIIPIIIVYIRVNSAGDIPAQVTAASAITAMN